MLSEHKDLSKEKKTELVSSDITLPSLHSFKLYSDSQFIFYADADDAGKPTSIFLFDFADGSSQKLYTIDIPPRICWQLAVTGDKTILVGKGEKIIVPDESRSWKIPDAKEFSYPEKAVLTSIFTLGKNYLAGNVVDYMTHEGSLVSLQKHHFFLLNLVTNEIQISQKGGEVISALPLADDQFKLLVRLPNKNNCDFKNYSISVNFREKNWLSDYVFEIDDLYQHLIDCSPDEVRITQFGNIRIFDIKRHGPRLLADQHRYEYKLDSSDYFSGRSSGFSSDGSFYFIAPGGKLIKADHGNVDHIATLSNVRNLLLMEDDRLITAMKSDETPLKDKYYYRIYKTRSYLYQELFSELLLRLQFPEKAAGIAASQPLNKMIIGYAGSYHGLFSTKLPSIKDNDKALVTEYFKRLRELPYSQHDHSFVDMLIEKLNDEKKTLHTCLTELQEEITKSEGKLNPSGAFVRVIKMLSASLLTLELSLPSASP